MTYKTFLAVTPIAQGTKATKLEVESPNLKQRQLGSPAMLASALADHQSKRIVKVDSGIGIHQLYSELQAPTSVLDLPLSLFLYPSTLYVLLVLPSFSPFLKPYPPTILPQRKPGTPLPPFEERDYCGFVLPSSSGPRTIVQRRSSSPVAR